MICSIRPDRRVFLFTAICLVALLTGSLSVAETPYKTASEYNAAGVESYNAGNWKNAVDLFVQANELAPENNTVKHNLCNAYHAYANALARDADYENAIKLLEEAISIEPQNPMPLVQLGSYFLRLDLIPEAIFRLEEAVELAPGNVDAHDLLGDAYYRNNLLAAALEQWLYVKAVAPKRRGLAEKLEKATREESVESKYRNGTSKNFDISFAPGTSGSDYRSVLYILEKAYMSIGRKFGRVFPNSPIQVIVYTAEDFSEATLLAEHVGALYDGKIRVPLFNRNGEKIDKEELKRRLHHEYVHVVVRTMVKDNVSWWLNEGLAQMYSEELSERDIDLLKIANEQGLLFKLSDLESNQLRKLDPTTIRLAYCQAHVAVRYLNSRYGQRRIMQLLSGLTDGLNTSDAFRTYYRRTYDAISREVEYHISRL